LLTGIGVAQNHEQCLKTADSLFDSQNYELAEMFYRRIIFFDTAKNSGDYYFKLSECLFFTEKYDDAMFYYDIAYQNTDDVFLSNDILFRKAMIFLLKKELNHAKRELLSVDTSVNNETNSRYFFYAAIMAYRDALYDTSRQLFIQSLQNKTDSNSINDIFSTINTKEKPNPTTAMLLSMLVPGLGQLYAGDIKNAINSFALNTLLAGVFLFVSQKYGVLDAALSVFPWFQRYYFGGFNRAKQIAIARQQNKKEELLLEIVKVFENTKN